MSGRRNGKKEVVRIDVDWLLSESTNPSDRDSSWFRPIFIALVCILISVWSWPYASKEWLKWEWQQQLAHISGQHAEDVMPILLALHELNPSRTFDMVLELGSSDSSKRYIAFHLLERRIQQWSGTIRPTESEMKELIDSLNSEHIRLPESILLRGQLAAQIRPLIRKDVPDAWKLLASIDAMIIQSEPSGVSATEAESVPKISKTDVVAMVVPAAKPTIKATQFRINDNSMEAVEPNDPPIIPQLQGSQSNAAKIVMRTIPPSSNSGTLTDHAAATTVSQLPNLNISIPRTVAKAIMVQTPSLGAEPVEANVPLPDKVDYESQEFTMISGIDKRTLENLMPLLTSSQPRIVKQAFNELVRRRMTPSHLEIVIELAQGNVEQRLKAMDTIARDPSFHDRIPWLVWMAESADRNVRRRAVALLGSMTDPEAMRKLRILQSREPDSTIADQISQVLLASGTASISLR